MLGLGNSITYNAPLYDAFTWVPTDVSGLVLWHRNDTNIAVGQWNDSSGNNNHAVQSTAGNQAAIERGGFHFDGTDDFYEYSTQLNIGESEAYTLAIVYKLDVIDTSNKATIFSKDANSTFFEFFDSDTVRINYNGNVVNLNGGSHAAGSDKILVATRSTSGAHKLYENGSDTVVTTATKKGVALWENLGIRNDNDRAFNGRIYEVMVWDNVEFSGADLTNLNTYLTNVKNDL
tara:strand:+ start:439 stop:1137 length:699 start_codon:yes stop_codon:yes gene_type:complete